MIQWLRTKKTFWFRVCGYGLHIKDMRLDDYIPFSQRYGYVKYKMVGPYKVMVLRPVRQQYGG